MSGRMPQRWRWTEEGFLYMLSALRIVAQLVRKILPITGQFSAGSEPTSVSAHWPWYGFESLLSVDDPRRYLGPMPCLLSEIVDRLVLTALMDELS